MVTSRQIQSTKHILYHVLVIWCEYKCTSEYTYYNDFDDRGKL